MPTREAQSSQAICSAERTALGGLLLAAGAHAEDIVPAHPMMSDRFFVGAGAAWVQSNVTANLNTGRIGLGTVIDFEDDLGLKKTNALGLFDFRWHFTKRFLLDAEYFSLNRDGEKELTRTIDWGEREFPISAAVNGSFNMQVSSTGEDWRGKAQVRYTGPYLFVTSTF